MIRPMRVSRGSMYLTLALISGLPVNASAQELNIEDLQKNIDIFADVLAEALDLEQASGLFGISLGGIDNTYLYGQGVVLEVRTPLASRRNTMNLASLNSTLQSIQSRANPFAALSQTDNAGLSQSRSLELAATASDADDFYQNMMDKIANVDYSLMVNSAIQQASEYARSLRALEGVDDTAYQLLRSDLEGLRAEMQDSLNRLREIETEARDVNGEPANRNQRDELQSSLDAVLAKLEPLRDRAVEKAEELRERSRLAEQEYAAKWLQEVAEFEAELYAAMCDYGSTLHELPVNENVSVILTGLGDDKDTNRRADKVHVFSKQDLQQCQNGDIDLQSLQQRSTQYSY